MQTQTKPQKLTALPPADELGARFCDWFSHPWNWIYAQRTERGKKLDWLTETRYPLQPRNLWEIYQDPHKYKVIGLRFGSETRYCLVDIDRGSPYHPANNYSGFKDVLAALEEIGLIRPLVVRSSDSEGIHIYLFLPEPVPTFGLACAIKYALEEAGLDLRAGELESFPNVKAFSKGKPTDYNGHRLPLQADSYWLSEDGEILTDDLAQFLDAADVAAAHQDFATLQKAIAAAADRRVLGYIPGSSSRAQEWKRHLEERIAQGWTGRGQTNELLKDFAVYGVVWEALSDDALVDFVVATAQAAPGYRQYCRHQHEIRSRAADWAQAAEKFYSPYRSFPKRDGRSYQENFGSTQNNIVNFPNQHNIKTRELAAERIRQALAHLEATDTLPYGATARAAVIIATVKELTGTGMSLATLHKPCHLPLWHPGQQKTLEPAQEATLHPTLEESALEKTLEPAQEATLHPTPLYEGLGQNAPLPEPPLRGVGEQGGIQSTEHTPTPLSRDVAGGSPARPSTDDCHTNCHNVTASAAPAAPTTPVAPATPSGFKLPLPPGAPPEIFRRVLKVHLAANNHAEKAIRTQQVFECQLFDADERNRRQAIAYWQFMRNSGDPIWMAEAAVWAADHPGLLPEVIP